MCLAIVKPQNKTIKKEYLVNGFNNNPDGAGFAFVHDGEVQICKGFFDFDDFYKAYSCVMKEYNKPKMLIHFRLASLGALNDENCHPFRINKSLVFIHNGTFRQPSLYSGGNEFSDTMRLRNKIFDVFKDLDSDFIHNPMYIDIVKIIAGNSNKICFLNANNEVVIVNEQLGFFEDGSWFSNFSCQ